MSLTRLSGTAGATVLSFSVHRGFPPPLPSTLTLSLNTHRRCARAGLIYLYHITLRPLRTPSRAASPPRLCMYTYVTLLFRSAPGRTLEGSFLCIPGLWAVLDLKNDSWPFCVITHFGDWDVGVFKWAIDWATESDVGSGVHTCSNTRSSPLGRVSIESEAVLWRSKPPYLGAIAYRPVQSVSRALSPQSRVVGSATGLHERQPVLPLQTHTMKIHTF